MCSRLELASMPQPAASHQHQAHLEPLGSSQHCCDELKKVHGLTKVHGLQGCGPLLARLQARQQQLRELLAELLAAQRKLLTLEGQTASQVSWACARR